MHTESLTQSSSTTAAVPASAAAAAAVDAEDGAWRVRCCSGRRSFAEWWGGGDVDVTT